MLYLHLRPSFSTMVVLTSALEYFTTMVVEDANHAISRPNPFPATCPYPIQPHLNLWLTPCANPAWLQPPKSPSRSTAVQNRKLRHKVSPSVCTHQNKRRLHLPYYLTPIGQCRHLSSVLESCGQLCDAIMGS